MTSSDAAIPTMYNGVQFRSRLEARWAAFFDQCGWKWDYEPLDLDGYIPDFVLAFYKPLLVEIKPTLEYESLALPKNKIECSGWAREAVILGPLGVRPTDSEPDTIGVLCERDGEETWWADARLIRCLICDKPSIIHADGGWNCRVSGCYDGNGHIGGIDSSPMWRAAGNAVQWRRPERAI